MLHRFIKKKWWRRRRIDESRRRLSHLVFVQYPEDLLPNVQQSQLFPEVTEEHMATTIKMLQATLHSDVSRVADLLPNWQDAEFVRRWPGEHYRLLAGMSQFMKPALIVEVGTYKGAAAAVLSLNAKQVVTFDVVRIDEIPDSIPNLSQVFPNVSQVVGDLLDGQVWRDNSHLFREADLVFVDGPKDGIFEPQVVPRIVELMRPGTVLVLDDIRFASMQKLWTDLLKYPRLDIGCFGHFSGTGLIFR